MRARSIVILAGIVLTLIAIFNLFFHGFHAIHELARSRIEIERDEALRVPFTNRQHRLERRPRLESDDGSIHPVNARGVRRHKQADSKERDGNATTLAQGPAAARRKYHVIVTSDGELYNQWQSRICYYWYKKARDADAHHAMGGFTRVLHSGRPDNFMEEIPTVVVEPLSPEIAKGYVVLNRPYAFLQWYRNYSSTIPEDYIFMAEPDHLFIRAPPLWATPEKGAAFPFSYIEPAKHANILAKYNPTNVPMSNFKNIGNSPVMLHKDVFGSIVVPWLNISLAFKNDPEADSAFGWILEMYAFSVASATREGGPIPYDIRMDLAVQPPFDTSLSVGRRPVCIIHYTYACDYDASGVLRYVQRQAGGYHWDKRDFSGRYPPRPLPLPPDNIRDGGVVRKMIEMLNEAMEHIEGWPQEP